MSGMTAHFCPIEAARPARRAATAAITACAIVLAALCGCAGGPTEKPQAAGAPVANAPVANVRAVEMYLPRSASEAVAQTALEAGDLAARKRIAEAVSRYEAALNAPPDTGQDAAEERNVRLRAARDEWDKEVAAGCDSYETFLRAYPHNWYERHRYAWFLADHGLRPQAAVEWEKVIQLEPRFPYAYNNLGTLYNHMGRDAEAIQLFRKALELKEDDPDFHVNLAVNYSIHRQEAMDLYGWTLPDVFWKCIGEYRRAAELAPNDADIARELATQFIMAKFFNVTGTADEALKAYDHYLSLELSGLARAAACRDVGRIYLKEKEDPQAALEWFEKSLALLDEPGTRSLMDQAREAIAVRQEQPPR